MTNSPHLAERVRGAFKPTPRGVVGLVDDLLCLCRVHRLLINFQDSHCYVRPLGTDAQDSFDVPLPKSVFRAVLARVAALCNERHPHSVTPYRGEGEIVVPSPILEECVAPSTCHVSFTNTPSEQRLELAFSSRSVGDATRFTVLLRDKRTVTVHGHALKYVQNASDPTDLGSYAILSRVGGAEVIVALVRVSEVIGVFCGDIVESVRSKEETATSRRDSQRQRALNDPSQGL